MSAVIQPRGIRNNNPGNIRHIAGVTWLGQSTAQTDDAFVQFTDPIYGIRAIARIMKSYEREGIDTLAAAIDRWAPPNENNSQAYVEAVCAACSTSPTAIVSLEDLLPQLVAGITLHENGIQPYSDAQIAQGVSLA